MTGIFTPISVQSICAISFKAHAGVETIPLHTDRGGGYFPLLKNKSYTFCGNQFWPTSWGVDTPKKWSLLSPQKRKANKIRRPWRHVSHFHHPWPIPPHKGFGPKKPITPKKVPNPLGGGAWPCAKRWYGWDVASIPQLLGVCFAAVTHSEMARWGVTA